MSTNKHIDKICIAVICLTLVITILFMNGSSLGLAVMARSMKYESTLFDNSYVHKIDIIMNDWDSFIETCENEEYTTCTIVIDGNKHKNIAIRAKGNTSLSSVKSMGSERYSFKLEFDHYEDGKTCDGLDKLCLNNLIDDNTMMKDYLVYQMMADFGVDAPLCSYAYLTVNGEDWGLYLAAEGIEDSFLERNYGSEIGELYKPDSLSFGGGRGNGKDFNMDDFDFDSSNIAGGGSDFNMDNFQPSGGFNFSGSFSDMPNMSGGNWPRNIGDMFDGGSPGGFSGSGFGGKFGGMGSDDVKLKYIDDDPDSYSNIFDNAKTDITKSDKERLINSLKNLTNYTNLEDTVDVDEVIRYFVVHNFVCNGDSYTGSMIHNYYLHEKDGQLTMIPWDYNLAFGTFQGGNASSSVNASIDNPVSNGNMDDRPMIGWIFSSEEYTDLYHNIFSEFIKEWYTNGRLESLINDTSEMISPYVEKDPTKFCSYEEFETGVDTITQFVNLRFEAVSNQLEGNNTIVDTGDLNLSDMGSMSSGMGGGKTNPQGDRDNNREFDFQTDGDFKIPSRGDFSNPTSGEFEVPPKSNLDTNTEEDGRDFSSPKENDNKSQYNFNNNLNNSTPGGDLALSNINANPNLKKWLLVGISFVALLIGIYTVMKKKV